MKIKEATNDLQSMSQDGDAILRSLQNKTMPMIDLMVRESLQNSLDATKKGEKETIVNFYINDFDTAQLSPHLEGVTGILNEKFPGIHKVIAVSDKNTVGLTGDYLSNDVKLVEKSNFQKLVFGIGKNQEQEGAGGSWGLGKTSYFRMGNGIVLYYSRIKKDNDFEERLIASLIESPKQKDEDRLLPNNLRGIAWWGEYGQEKDKLLPITEEEHITEILSVFGLENYKGEETGTTIIVPYVDALDKENQLYDHQDNWKTKYSDAIKMATQRWYTPRLCNKTYSQSTGNSYLICAVNKEVVIPGVNTEPVFKYLQEIYNSALKGKAENNSINVLPIELPSNGLKHKEPIGYVAFSEISYEQLQMNPPENRESPLIHLGLDYGGNTSTLENVDRVLGYCRKPGMVIEYSRTNDWIPSNISVQEDHYLLAFFVPNSKAELRENYQYIGYLNVEAYLRATENADHASWADEDKITIIKRIKANTLAVIQKYYNGDENNNSSSATSGLSRKFGALLMPPKGYGRTGNNKKGKGSGNGRNGASKGPKPKLVITSTNILDKNNLELFVDLKLMPGTTNKVYLYINGQDQKLDYISWLDTFNKSVKFPVSFSSVEILSNIENALIKTESGVTSELKFDSVKNEPVDLKVKFTIYMHTHQYQPLIGIKTENKRENEGAE